MRSDRLGQRVFLGLAFLFVLFIAYVSWRPVPDEAYLPHRSFFRGIERLPYLFFPHYFRDFATNILLYIPLGVLVASAFARKKPGFAGRWLFLGFAVSVTMEMGQSFFGRYPDAIDIVTNTLGYAIGYWVVVGAVRFYHLDPVALIGFDAREDQRAATQAVAVARFAYICIYLLVAMLPFDVSVRYYELYAQLFPDALGHTRLILDPFYHFSRGHAGIIGLLLGVLWLLPVAVLSALLDFAKGRFDVLTAVLPCLVVALLSEVSQLFVLSRTSDVAMFPVAFVSGTLGWAAARGWYAWRGLDTSPRRRPPTRWRWRLLAAASYALALALMSLWPFEFEIDHRFAADKIFGDLNLVPFRYTTSMWDVARTAGAFVPLGFLISYLLIEVAPGMRREKTIVSSAVLCAVFSVFVEFSQTICVGRFFDATDVVLALLGGFCGAALAEPFRSKTAVTT
jgi:glycopeptide antibiotics resistance protein